MKKLVFILSLLISSIAYSQTEYVEIANYKVVEIYFRNSDGSDFKMVNNSQSDIEIKFTMFMTNNICTDTITHYMLLKTGENYLCLDVCELGYINSVSIQSMVICKL